MSLTAELINTAIKNCRHVVRPEANSIKAVLSDRRFPRLYLLMETYFRYPIEQQLKLADVLADLQQDIAKDAAYTIRNEDVYAALYVEAVLRTG